MAKKTSKNNKPDDSTVELMADMQRIQADFANYRRRAEEDQMRAVSVGREATISALLPTIDNIDRALMHVPKDLVEHEYIKGLKTVAKQFIKDLEDMGLEKMKTVGKEFDPELMEAVHMEDCEGDKEMEVEELTSGYKLNGQVIRHAMVQVGKE